MSSLIVWATDKGFIVPSLVAASQVRANQATIKPDINIYLSDFTNDEAAILQPVADALEISLIRVSTDILRVNADSERLFNRGISPTALMRLAIADILPTTYSNIVYLDGDMQVHGPLDELLAKPPPPGKIAAVAECYVILRDVDGSRRPWVVDQLTTLGLTNEKQYMNSGMLSFAPSTWPKIAAQALEFFRENSEICPNYDQCALNAVLKGEWLPIHPAYNWHSHFHHLAGPGDFPKRVVHFTTRPKPWQLAQSSWSPLYYFPYKAILNQYPELSRFFSIRNTPPPMLYAKYGANTLRRQFRQARYRRWLDEYLKSQTFLVDAPTAQGWPRK